MRVHLSKLLILFSILAAGCGVTKDDFIKFKDETNASINSNIASLDTMKNKTLDQERKGQITTEISKKVIKMIDDSMVKARSYQNKIIEIVNSPLSNKKKIVELKLVSADLIQFVTNTKEEMKFLNDMYSKNKVNDFGLGSTFKAGEYRLKTESERMAAVDVYADLCEDILEDFIRTKKGNYVADITVYGYSDEIEFSDNSPIKAEIIEKYGLANPTDSELNLKLSELRAITVSELISEYISKVKDKDVKSRLKVVIRSIGKGIELPNSDQQYNKHDERRRIVKIKWILVNRKHYE
jgi:hypothetical protein